MVISNLYSCSCNSNFLNGYCLQVRWSESPCTYIPLQTKFQLHLTYLTSIKPNCVTNMFWSGKTIPSFTAAEIGFHSESKISFNGFENQFWWSQKWAIPEMYNRRLWEKLFPVKHQSKKKKSLTTFPCKY
jgi:hypothetical protein